MGAPCSKTSLLQDQAFRSIFPLRVKDAASILGAVFWITRYPRDTVIAKVANNIHKMQLRCFCNLDCLWHPSKRTPITEKCTAYSRDFLFTRKHESKLSDYAFQS